MLIQHAQPLVSICIPTYNHASTLADAIASARAQTYGHIEILILDNQSNDGTAAIVTEAMARDSRTRYERHQRNIGMARNFTACIHQARGELIKFLCADDILAPDCVEKMVAVLARDERVALVACARHYVDERLAPIRIARLRRASAIIDGHKVARECFCYGNGIGEPTAVLFRRNDGLRGFDPRYEQPFDLEMWMHLLEKGPLALLAEPLCSVRLHGGQATRANIRSGRIVEDKRLMYREITPRLRPELSWLDKCAWDTRMASSIARARLSGAQVEGESVSEVFSPLAFRLMLPVAALAWRARTFARQ